MKGADTHRRLGRFLLRVLLWLPLCYGVWFLAAPVLLAPAVLMTRAALGLTTPDLIAALYWADGALQVYTRLSAGEGHYGFTFDPLAYGYGLVLLAALVLATPAPRRWASLAIGLMLLQPFIAWGLYFAILRTLLEYDPAVLPPGLTEAVQFAARIGLLLFAPLTPVLVWGLLERSHLQWLAGVPDLHRPEDPPG